jgi:hypothetical protein
MQSLAEKLAPRIAAQSARTKAEAQSASGPWNRAQPPQPPAESTEAQTLPYS